MKNHYNVIGVGIGLFNLSFASLLSKTPGVTSLFFDQKPAFDWHSEIMFGDSEMQTSFLKDLVTPADPTNPGSFMNYLVQNGLYYSFLNTNRQSITRREFELYCQWVAGNLEDQLRFSSHVETVNYDGEKFVFNVNGEVFTSDHICVGTGLSPRLPDFAEVHLGNKVFHAKSSALKNMNTEGQRVVVVGGGQTGIEIFRNTLLGKWGQPKSIQLISSRANLEPLDNSPFVNEYFAPSYVEEFLQLNQKMKDSIVGYQKLASDGNTPAYLEKMYNDLYQIKHIAEDPRTIEILPFRRLENLTNNGEAFTLAIRNNFARQMESLEADIVILSTGFQTAVPKMIDSLRPLIHFDELGRFQMGRSFDVEWEGSAKNKIYALNFSRHGHGISEPQTSLMAWRSATIINDFSGKEIFPLSKTVKNFVTYLK